MKSATQTLIVLSLLTLIAACGGGVPDPTDSRELTGDTPDLASAIEQTEPAQLQPVDIEPQVEESDNSTENSDITDIEIPEESNDTEVAIVVEPEPEPVKNIAEPESFGPLMDYTESAVDAYDGLDTVEPLSLDATSAFITNTFFGFAKPTALQEVKSSSKQQWLDFRWDEMFQLPEVSLKTDLFFLPKPKQYTCYRGAEANGSLNVTLSTDAVDEHTDRRTYTLQYNQCAQDPDKVFNGELVTVHDWDKSTLSASNVYLAYNNLRIADSSQHTELNGTVKWPDPQACKFAGAKTYYLNAKNLHTGKSLFLENFKTAFFSIDQNDCTQENYQPNYFSGRIFNSDFGAVNVSTPSHLQLSLDNPYFYQKPFNTSEGEVTFDAAGASATFSLSQYSKLETFNEYDQPVKLATLSLNNIDTNVNQTYSQHAKLFWHGGLSNLNDTDQDTMIDSWEQLSGLNTDDANDADSDFDNDNRTALWEFNNLGIANNTDEYGVTFDREVKMVAERDSIYQRDIKITIDSQITGTRYKDTDHTVVVTANAVGTWNTAEAPCTVNAENNTLVCSHSFNFTQPAIVSFTPAADGAITFTAHTSIPEQDFNPDNNQTSTTIPFEIRVTDYAVNWANAPENTQYLVEGEPDFIYAEAKLLSTNADSWMYFTIEYPEHININSASFGYKSDLHTQTYPNNCFIADTIICQTGLSNSSDILALRLQVSVQEPSEHTLRLSTPTEEYDPNHANNAASLTLKTLNNTDTLQALIDSALPGSTVELPSGDFAGPLSLNNKQLILKGSVGSYPTTLYSLDKYDHSITNTGSYTLIEHIHFKSAGLAIAFNAGDYLTIADNHFEQLLIDDASIVFPIIDSDTPMSGNSGLPRDASYRFINNRVTNLGFKPESECDGLLPSVGWRSVFVERNTFYNIDCNSVFTGQNHDQGSATQALHILNNTFSNVSTIINFVFEPADGPHHTRAENNIFSDVHTFFGFGYLSSYVSSQSSITSNANLIYNHTRYHFMSNDMLAKPSHNFIINDIGADPLFVDSQNADFRIMPGSRAVDAGVDVSIGDMGINYNGEVVYTDGLGNGQITPDIGAWELAP